MDAGTILAAIGVSVAAYLIGGIPFGIVVARIVGGRDPRSVGSGRTGGANAVRALGRRWGILAGFLDAFKGSVGVLIPRLLGLGPACEVLGAIFAIVGHSRSPYIGFGGGRGVSVAWGTLLVIEPLVAIAILPVFLGLIAITRISSIGSLVGTLSGGLLVIVLVFVQGLPGVYVVYAVGSVFLIWLFHLDNIGRLLAGTERRVDQRH